MVSVDDEEDDIDPQVLFDVDVADKLKITFEESVSCLRVILIGQLLPFRESYLILSARRFGSRAICRFELLTSICKEPCTTIPPLLI